MKATKVFKPDKQAVFDLHSPGKILGSRKVIPKGIIELLQFSGTRQTKRVCYLAKILLSKHGSWYA